MRKFRIAVNLSARQLDDGRLAATVAAALSDSRLPPEALMLEITETALIENEAAAAATLRKLKQLGVQIAIDDIGTGHCTFAYLRFPIDAIKISRSFISGDLPPREAALLTAMIVKIGKRVGLEVFGEGIETEAQLHQLQDLQCDFGQGFHFARPVRPAVITALLRTADGLATPAHRALPAPLALGRPALATS